MNIIVYIYIALCSLGNLHFNVCRGIALLFLGSLHFKLTPDSRQSETPLTIKEHILQMQYLG